MMEDDGMCCSQTSCLRNPLSVTFRYDGRLQSDGFERTNGKSSLGTL